MAREIVIALGGAHSWNFIGDVVETATTLVIKNAYCIRRWGTTAGLGELAVNGPTDQTLLDYYGDVEVCSMDGCIRIKCVYEGELK